MTLPAPSPTRIVDVVFTTRPGPRVPALPLGVLLAVVIHAGVAGWAVGSTPSLGVWAARMQQAVRAELSNEQTVDLVAPPPPVVVEKEPEPEAPPPVLKSEPRAPEPRAEPVARAPEPQHTQAPAPAQAGNIVAQEEDADAPVDLTENTFVTGKASAYVGGVTASKGTNTVAVKTRQVVTGGAVGVATAPRKAAARVVVPQGPDNSAPPRLLEDDWSCPWPREAEEEQIDEQTAMVRVTISAAGTVKQVTLMEDPGFGFGRAAVACALKAHFSPGLDRSGRPVESTSPPIRVHFFR